MSPKVPSPETVYQAYESYISAGITLLFALALAQVLDRWFARRGRRLSRAVAEGAATAGLDTRLRIVRRLLYATILVVGIALAVSQFEPVRRTATAVLASSAVLGIVVGFAARQTFANLIAGIQLVITQPIRVGDLVTFGEDTGTIEDVRLSYTYMRADDGRRIIIPNEMLSQSTIENHTIIDPRVRVEVSVWIPPEADSARALEVLAEEPDAEVSVAEVDKDGVRITISKQAPTVVTRGEVAAGLRARALERLHREGLSSRTET
ncbi:MAG: mechanosensitive ion channel [Thermoleophilaceae bacterium]|nr:mechanosensitive ion channel [Thermoleophilaceae bacterium]